MSKLAIKALVFLAESALAQPACAGHSNTEQAHDASVSDGVYGCVPAHSTDVFHLHYIGTYGKAAPLDRFEGMR